MNLTNMQIEPVGDHGYCLTYQVDQEIRVITQEAETVTDKSDVRKILLSVIKNFNEMNPHYKIVISENGY